MIHARPARRREVSVGLRRKVIPLDMATPGPGRTRLCCFCVRTSTDCNRRRALLPRAADRRLRHGVWHGRHQRAPRRAPDAVPHRAGLRRAAEVRHRPGRPWHQGDNRPQRASRRPLPAQRMDRPVGERFHRYGRWLDHRLTGVPASCCYQIAAGVSREPAERRRGARRGGHQGGAGCQATG